MNGGGATKAAPREKVIRFGSTRYEVLERSYINGAIREPGEEIFLPEGVTAGTNLRKSGGDAVRDDTGGEAEAFIGRNADLVIADIPALTDAELDEYQNAEKGGKARVSVLNAFEKEVESRKPA